MTATLFCEGPEDARFLERVLSRQLIALGTQGDGFDTGDVFTQRCRTVESSDRVRDAVGIAARDFDVVFIHQDWNERGKIESLRAQVHRDVPDETRMIAVVPVRETEAWVLADPNAFSPVRGSLAESLPSRPKDVETVRDPKGRLATALGRPYDERIAEFIAERIDLERLAQVPAYGIFLEELTNALKELRFL